MPQVNWFISSWSGEIIYPHGEDAGPTTSFSAKLIWNKLTAHGRNHRKTGEIQTHRGIWVHGMVSWQLPIAGSKSKCDSPIRVYPCLKMCVRKTRSIYRAPPHSNTISFLQLSCSLQHRCTERKCTFFITRQQNKKIIIYGFWFPKYFSKGPETLFLYYVFNSI